ncbi:MAG: 30S ribosomal protein S1, partial [Anaerolineales bacterium]
MDENHAQTGAEEDVQANLPKTEQTEMPSMQDLLEQTDMELEIPQPGEIREGTIMHVGEDEILVSIGAKSEGVIHARELERLEDDERSELLVAGKTIPVYVIKPEDQNGNVLLSFVRAKEEKDWEWVEELLQSEDAHDAKIAGYNKGGLIVPMGSLRGFVPASQVSALRRISKEGDTNEQRWAKMVGEPIKIRVIEVDRGRRRLILSERAALKETREALKERLLDELNEGDVRTGRVTSLADFGAFVNIDGADGLVHLSEISWDRIDHPSEVLEVGQQVEVKVISVDRDRRRIGLSIRQLQEDPWVRKAKNLRVGQLVEGTVTHLTKFGAFAKIEDDDDLEGLIHISELSEQRIGHPKEVVKEGDKLTLRIIKVETDRRRIGLSLRKVDSAAYADLDWKIALSEEVDDFEDEEDYDLEIEDELAETAEGEPEVVETVEVVEIAEADDAAEAADEFVEAVEAEAAVEAEIEAEEVAEVVEAVEEAEIIAEAEAEAEAELAEEDEVVEAVEEAEIIAEAEAEAEAELAEED